MFTPRPMEKNKTLRPQEEDVLAVPFEPQEFSLDVEGCVLHGLEQGDLSGPPVLLLHGRSFQAATWRELGTLDILAGLGLHVLAVDMPGFGKSPACQQAPVDLLPRFLRARGIERAALIGPSMGGGIALEFAIRFPEQVSALVLVGAVNVAEKQDRLGAITVPTLIIWGGDDQVSPLANSDILLAAIAGAQREIYPGAPHPCYLSQPERWHGSLRAFFTGPAAGSLA